MAILKQVWKASLGTPGGQELSVVREDRNPEILFSVVETQGAVRRRITFALSATQAINLARFLAGVPTLASVQEQEDPEQEETTPTKPGRPLIVVEDLE